VSADQIIVQFFTFMSGRFGAAIIAITLLVAFLRMSAEHRTHYFGYAVLGGVGFFSVAWFMATFYGASVG
jgi:hypothetical protein